MTSEDYAAQITPNPVPLPRATMGSPVDFMTLQGQHTQEQDALTAQQRVADALMKATQPRPYQWRSKRQGRFAAQSSPFGGVGDAFQSLASGMVAKQAQDDLRDRQRLQMMQLIPMPPSAAAASWAKPLGPNDLGEG